MVGRITAVSIGYFNMFGKGHLSGCLTLDFGSSHDLGGCGIEPCVGLYAQREV